MQKKTISSAIILAITLIFSASLYAHRVNVFAWVEGSKIFIESNFAGGKPVKSGTVLIKNASDQIVFEGVTNENGEAEYQFNQPSDYLITVKAGSGHQGDWKINKHEITGDSEDQMEEVKTDETAEITVSIDNKNLSALLDQKLKSIHGQLKSLRQEIQSNKIRDIISGIGFILGIFGVIAILKSRTKRS